MQLRILSGSILVLMTMTASAASAGYVECCAGAPLPIVAFGELPVPFRIIPTGFVLDPSDGVPPYYLVNQGGPGFRTLSYARPAYLAGGYAYSEDYAYIVSTGRGYRAVPRRAYRADPFARPYGVPAYAAYRYRAAPSTRIIHLED